MHCSRCDSLMRYTPGEISTIRRQDTVSLVARLAIAAVGALFLAVGVLIPPLALLGCVLIIVALASGSPQRCHTCYHTIHHPVRSSGWNYYAFLQGLLMRGAPPPAPPPPPYGAPARRVPVSGTNVHRPPGESVAQGFVPARMPPPHGAQVRGVPAQGVPVPSSNVAPPPANGIRMGGQSRQAPMPGANVNRPPGGGGRAMGGQPRQAPMPGPNVARPPGGAARRR